MAVKPYYNTIVKTQRLVTQRLFLFLLTENWGAQGSSFFTPAWERGLMSEAVVGAAARFRRRKAEER